MNSSAGGPAPTRRFDGLRLVALLKFGKALLLLATAYGAYRLLDPSTEVLLTQWSETVTDRFVRNLLLKGLEWIGSLDVAIVDGAAVIGAVYLTLVLVEGFGLWFRQRWAEWLTVIATSTLIPFELWKLFFHPTGKSVIVLGVLIMNVAVVLYLGLQLKKTRGHRSADR